MLVYVREAERHKILFEGPAKVPPHLSNKFDNEILRTEKIQGHLDRFQEREFVYLLCPEIMSSENMQKSFLCAIEADETWLRNGENHIHFKMKRSATIRDLVDKIANGSGVENESILLYRITAQRVTHTNPDESVFQRRLQWSRFPTVYFFRFT